MKLFGALFIFSFVCLLHGALAQTYIGCYIDHPTRDLSRVPSSSSSMTVDRCVVTCRNLNYSYAGLQAGSQCACGNNYGRYGRVSESDCNTTCVGNSAQICGAGWRNSIYKITGYIGCYVDNATRDLSGNLKEEPLMTIARCLEICRNLSYRYAGLQTAYYCLCGNSYGRHGKASENDCNSRCPGNNAEICGAPWRNSIYGPLDFDECAYNTDNCDENHAQCTTIPATYNCTCNDGYEGNGRICTDVDECARNINNCSVNAHCNNTEGSYNCTCNDGYEGNGIICIAIVVVTCSPGSIIVEVSRYFYTEKDIQIEDLHLRNYSCKGVVNPDTPEVWVFNTGTLSSCSNELSVNDTHFIYSNVLSNTIVGGIFTGNGVFTKFSCAYKRDLEGLTVSFGGMVIRNTEVIIIPREGKFAATMNRFTDLSFQEKETKVEYDAKDSLFIQLQLETDSPSNFNLVIDRCWVTPTPDMNHSNRYPFIEDRCPRDGSNGNVNITRSGNGTVANFRSKVFSYVDYNTTFIHCSLFVCLSAENESCVPGCLQKRASRILVASSVSPSERKKRQAPSIENDIPNATVTLGPFVVRRDVPVSNSETSGLSFSMLLAILVAVVIIVVASLAFAAFWFRGRHIHKVESNQQGIAGFTNAAMTKE